MKLDRNKYELALARTCMSVKDLQKKTEMPRATINGAITGRGARPETIGKIAKALNVDVTEIIEQ